MGTPIQIKDAAGNPVYIDTNDTNAGSSSASPLTNKVAVSNFPSVQNTNVYVGGSAASAANGVPMYDAYTSASSGNWTSATALNTAVAINVQGFDTVTVSHTVSGTVTGGAVAFEVYDGAYWVGIKGSNILNYTTAATYSLTAGTAAFQIPVAGFQQFRCRLSTAISGSGSVQLQINLTSAPDTSIVTVGLDPSQPLPAGTNNLGNVNSKLVAGTSGGVNPNHYISVSGTNGNNVKSSQGLLYAFQITNLSVSQCAYVKFYDKATNPTVGTDVPKKTIAIPAAVSANQPTVVILSQPLGINFLNGISFAITGGYADSDNTSVSAGNVICEIDYL